MTLMSVKQESMAQQVSWSILVDLLWVGLDQPMYELI